VGGSPDCYREHACEALTARLLHAAVVPVLTLPQDPDRHGHPSFYRTAVADANGGFTLADLTPGAYRIFAWEEVEAGAWLDLEFVRPIAAKGVALSLKEDDQKTAQSAAIPAGQ